MVDTKMESVTTKEIRTALFAHITESIAGGIRIAVDEVADYIAALVAERQAACLIEVARLREENAAFRDGRMGVLHKPQPGDLLPPGPCEKCNPFRAWITQAKTAIQAMYHDPSCPDYPHCQVIGQPDSRVVGITCQCHCREFIKLLNEEI